MTSLSAHFTLEEALLSQTASRLGILNDPPLDVVRNMKEAALGMELVRAQLGGLPININSWYRSPDLNHAVGSKPTSAHITGFAIDFTCSKYGTPRQIADFLIKSGVKYQQLILEFDSWVHIAFNGAICQNLIIDKTGTRPYE